MFGSEALEGPEKRWGIEDIREERRDHGWRAGLSGGGTVSAARMKQLRESLSTVRTVRTISTEYILCSIRTACAGSTVRTKF